MVTLKKYTYMKEIIYFCIKKTGVGISNMLLEMQNNRDHRILQVIL